MLAKIAPALPDAPFASLQLGHRMSVARLPDGTRWLHSPVE